MSASVHASVHASVNAYSQPLTAVQTQEAKARFKELKKAYKDHVSFTEVWANAEVSTVCFVCFVAGPQSCSTFFCVAD